MSRKSHKNLVLSLTTSVILHSFLFFLAYILKGEREDQVYNRHSPYHIHEGLYFDTFLFLN